jgi:predicted polyphosphate/ATP-dependent NAD kinase
MRLEVGLLVNPVAGIGGSVALKGSDGTDVQAQARALGGTARGGERTRRVLTALGDRAGAIDWLACAGAMGADYLSERGITCRVLGRAKAITTRDDTCEAAKQMARAGVDLLIFAGGDGTARDILEAVDERLPVLGIPAGVKMHSGVFATTPEQAGELVSRLISGGLVSVARREVRDLDEAALRQGELVPRYFGDLTVPEPGGYLQHTKERGRENESLAVTEIVADVVERLGQWPGAVVLGPGSTVGEIKRALGFEGTLLGFDVWRDGVPQAKDVNAAWLVEHLEAAVVVLSFTRGQGFLLGRGNQQLTPALLRRLGRDAIWVVGTRTKLASLEGRPLLLDTDDPALDREWSGLVEVTAGYEDRLFYRLSAETSSP